MVTSPVKDTSDLPRVFTRLRPGVCRLILVWGTMLLTDMALNPPLHGVTVMLQDIDAAALDLMARMGRKLSSQAGAGFRFETTTDLAAAVSGATVVVDCVGIGGLEAMRVDLEVPARYDIVQSVGVNVGPGGINRALRHIPHILQVCRTMETACPPAWLLILSNPLTQLTRAATRESSVKTIGLCHEMMHTRFRLSESLGLRPESLWFQVAGINHLPWITEWRIDGQDGHAFLRNWLAQHGKDVMTDKPGCTTLHQLEDVRRAQSATARIWSVCFSERFAVRAVTRTAELIAQGAIGRVVHMVGLGPHRLNKPQRPAWFFERARSGGILCDLASYQIDQFLYLTGSNDAMVVASAVANYANADMPELEDFGDVLLRSDRATGYARVEWYTLDGLPTWGDGRLSILRTEGVIEVRKYVDLAGRGGGDHLFLVTRDATQYVNCTDAALPYYPNLARDIRERTQTAMPQDHYFRVMGLALAAQARAVRLTGPAQSFK